MQEVQSPQFSVLASPTKETLKHFKQLEENTKRHLSNLPRLKVKLPSVDELLQKTWPRDTVCLARGPSFFTHDYVHTMKIARDMGQKFTLISADGAAAHCLEQGLIPDLVVTVDPSNRILRWFGDTVGETWEDEYFLKDRDAPKKGKALLSLESTISLFDKFGIRLSVAINPFTHEKVLDRLLAIGADIYMYLPLSDDKTWMKNLWVEYPKLPAISAGGNVGTCCYNFARFLGARKIALCAFDMGYPPGTPPEETQYFDLIRDHPELAKEMFVDVTNPNTGETWFTDMPYLMYATTFVRMARKAKQEGVETINCTGGGILFDDSIIWGPLTNYLVGTPADLSRH